MALCEATCIFISPALLPKSLEILSFTFWEFLHFIMNVPPTWLCFWIIVLCCVLPSVMNHKNLIQIVTLENHEKWVIRASQPEQSLGLVTDNESGKIQYNKHELLQLRDRVFHNKTLSNLPTETINAITNARIHKQRKRGTLGGVKHRMRRSAVQANLIEVIPLVEKTLKKTSAE